MSPRAFRYAALLLAVFSLCAYAAQKQSPSTLAKADKLYAEKSFGAALKIYEQLAKSGQFAPGQETEKLLRYRIVVCLGKTQQWDRALAASLAFVKAERGTVWEPRGLYWLGRLHLRTPSSGYKMAERFTRGRNVPKSEGGSLPMPMDFSLSDRLDALDAMEAARILYPPFRGAKNTAAEEAQLDFDIASVLDNHPRTSVWLDKKDWKAPGDPYWKVDGTGLYALDWPMPKKKVYLYRQITAIAPTAHGKALGRLGLALWLRSYHAQMRSNAVKYVNDHAVKIPYPYQSFDEKTVLRELMAAHPSDPLRDQAQLLLAAWLNDEGKRMEAMREYRALLAVHPKSPWAGNAKLGIEQIERRSLGIAPVWNDRVVRSAQISVSSRNVKHILFRLYPVKLDEVIDTQARFRNASANLNQFGENLGTIKQARKRYGPLAAEWEVDTKDNGRYAPFSDTVSIPTKKVGAYVVEASASGVRAAAMVLITDLVLIQKTHRDGATYFAADAATGRPVPNAKVIVKQWWQVNEKRFVAFDSVTTNQQGLVTVALRRGPGRESLEVAALATRGKSHAMTNPVDWWYGDGEGSSPLRVYSTTDRSAYRPGQKVYYRELVMRTMAGGLKPAVGRKVRVEVRSPKGEVVHQKAMAASEFGSVNGEFSLTAGAPLGEYVVNVSLPDEPTHQADCGGNRFRVEEYKKPEFEVTVAPEANRVKLGEPTSAVVSAKYYFGGPVPNAKVTYRIHRGDYAQQYQFPRPFDFLWRYWGEGDYDTSFRDGPVIKQGEVRTDAKGEAKISFETLKPAPAAIVADQAYTVEADVQDASRRTITGSGTVKATKQDIAAFLNYPHGYALKGDRLDIEVMTLNRSDQPVAAEGMAKVYRSPNDPKGKPILIHEEPLATDSHGRGYLRWKAATAGHFRIAFVTKDSGGEEVEGSTDVWVQGPELNSGTFHHEGVFLAAKNPYFEEGQTAKLLVVTPGRGCTVFLVREADNIILEKRMLRVPGRSMEIEVPLRHADVPNVYISVVVVRNGQVLTAQQELFVPPARQFSTVSVQADKTTYKPGEKATLRLAAKDWRGRPLRTELSVAVSDAALSYIQKDYAPDVRAFFYGSRRSVSTEVSGSPSVTFDATAEDDQPARKHVLRGWTFPDGMGMLQEEEQDIESRPMFNTMPARGAVHWSGRTSRVSIVDLGGSLRGSVGVNGPAGAPAMMRDAERPQGQMMSRLSRSYNDRVFHSDDTISARREKSKGLRFTEGADLVALTTRRKFADTAFWTPAVVTDSHGTATVQVTWPDNLTQWRANAVGTSAAAQVGMGDTKVNTTKDLLVRLQAPRFFVERDQVTLSANVQNTLPTAQRVLVKLELGGGTAVLPVQTSSEPSEGTLVDVPAEGEKRVDWTVDIRKEGALRVKMSAQSRTAADATEMVFPVLVHGVERQTAQSGVMRGGSGAATASIELPAARKPGSSELIVTLNPSLAGVMLDALPYLADYPYGCVEQTMSRFLPSVIVEKTLADTGYNLSDLRVRAKRLREPSRNPQAFAGHGEPPKPGGYTYPAGMPGTLLLTAPSIPRVGNPVLNERQLRQMVEAGMKRIREWQHADGGWGWWQDDPSDPYMTAYVLYGLLLARDTGQGIEADRLTRGLDYLQKHLKSSQEIHQSAYEARVLAMDPRYREIARDAAVHRLFPKRERLSAYSEALLAMALKQCGEAEKAGVVLRNIENTAKVDEANGTANWEEDDRWWWRWYNDKVETNAAILQAYVMVSPASKMAPMVAKWLVNNRRGDSWNSTKETAMAVYALADYARASKELAPDYTLTVDLGGQVQRKYRVDKTNALLFDNLFVVPDGLLKTGSQPLKITKSGTGALYWSAYTRTFSLEEPLKETGNEIFVSRRYYRLVPGTAQGTPQVVHQDINCPNPFLTGRYELLDEGPLPVHTGKQDGPRYDRTPLKDGDTLTSGDLIEVDLELNAKNDYDYVIFEDMKPAGCEPVEVRSGEKAGLGVYSNMELRDQKVAFFLSSMPQGTRQLSYRLRAETPGAFHVLPTNGYAMYAPDVRTLSSEAHFTIRDEEAAAP